jgi:MFS family permease
MLWDREDPEPWKRAVACGLSSRPAAVTDRSPTPRARPGRRIFADTTPLRQSVPYRWLYGGELVSNVGRQITIVAVPYQVFQLTHSSLAVGLVGLANIAPLILFSLIGGAIADAVDRRRLMLIMQCILGATSAGLAFNAAAPRPALWPLYALTAAQAGMFAIDSPTRTAVIPALVGSRELASAFALQQLLSQTGMAVGPAIAGVVIAQTGLSVAYALDAASFAVSALMLLPLGPLPPQGGGRRPGLASVMEGLRFLRGRPLLQSTFVIDLNAMIFGMPRALFPALGVSVFGGGAATVGLLFAAPGTGALIGAVMSGWVTATRRQGRAIVIAVCVWALAITAFGLTPWLWLALVLLAIAGAADAVSAVFRSTILQQSVPDALRGRVSAAFIAVVTGGPRLGDVEAGVVAAAIGAQGSVITGGLACLIGAGVVARRWPQLLAYVAPSATNEQRLS